MENPETWGRAERIVHETLWKADSARARGVTGLSRARQVCDALREAGLLRDEQFYVTVERGNLVMDIIDENCCEVAREIIVPDGKDPRTAANGVLAELGYRRTEGWVTGDYAWSTVAVKDPENPSTEKR